MSDYTDRIINHDDGLNIIDGLGNINGTLTTIASTLGLSARSAATEIKAAVASALIQSGNSDAVARIGDIIKVARETGITASATNAELTVTVDEDAFLNAMHEARIGEYEFVFDGAAWHLEGHPVILSNLGIAVTGTPVEGDAILVVEAGSEIRFRVVAKVENGQFGALKIKDKTKQRALVLYMEDVDYYGMSFDAQEALYYAEEGLEAGTYYFEKGTYDAANAPDTAYNFTLTQAVPAGGIIVLSWSSSTNISSARISTYAAVTDATAIESGIALAAGASGTLLGDVYPTDAATARTGNMNHITAARYGYNRYSQSFIRQNLNSSAAKGNYFVPQSKWDRAPTMAGTAHGFMHGMDPDFLDLVLPVEVETILNNVTDSTAAEAAAGTARETVVDRFFLPSRSEVFGGKDNASDNGLPFAYLQVNSDLSAAGTGVDENRSKANGATLRAYWLRSPNPASASNVRIVRTDGSLTSNSASSGYGRAAACLIG